MYPSWAPDGRLIFLSEATGWWNLYAWSGSDVLPLCPQSVDFCGPPWRLRTRPYALVGDDQLVCERIVDGVPTLALLDLATGELTTLTEDALAVEALAVAGDRLAAVWGSPTRPNRLASLSLDSGVGRTLRSASNVDLDPLWISIAEPVTWESDAGPVHGWYYPPTNPECTALADERPPLIVLSHGGPTAMALDNFSLSYQFWTSRGFAILDVNYGGSSGYGRAYRERLQGRWGIVDAADCVRGALAMAERGLADPRRLVISGGSAGGFTTLRVLTTTDVFAAGLSSYGIGDLEALARDTHKFESRYLDGLVGSLSERRSDLPRAVPDPPRRSAERAAAAAARRRGRRRSPFAGGADGRRGSAQGSSGGADHLQGEGHGFRRAETIQAATQAELYFLGRVLGFSPADELPPIKIENLS